MPTRPVQELSRCRLWNIAVTNAVMPSTRVTASSASWTGWGFPSVAKRPPAVLGRIACAIGDLLRKTAHGSAIHTRCVQSDRLPGRISTGSRCAGSLYRLHGVCPCHDRDYRKEAPIVSGGRYRCYASQPSCHGTTVAVESKGGGFHM